MWVHSQRQQQQKMIKHFHSCRKKCVKGKRCLKCSRFVLYIDSINSNSSSSSTIRSSTSSTNTSVQCVSYVAKQISRWNDEERRMYIKEVATRKRNALFFRKFKSMHCWHFCAEWQQQKREKNERKISRWHPDIGNVITYRCLWHDNNTSNEISDFH